ncbi:MAG TPA: hypothetical protein VM557_00640 [Thermoanaerobaculia bacterium]|nr:hypothetical protein [Thermoanaerobaculia bacterium]
MSAAPPSHSFEITRIEERWMVEDRTPRLLELRGERGRSVFDDAASPFPTLTATSLPFQPRSTDFGTLEDLRFAAVLDALPPGRFEVLRLRTRSAPSGAGQTSHLATVKTHGRSVVLAIDEQAVAKLRRLTPLLLAERGERPPVNPHQLPIVWNGGSAAVLLHEAVAHPSEERAVPIEWPSWLAVRDEPGHPGIGRMETDDAGRTPRSRDLLAGQEPSAWRREGFRNVPLRRLTNLVATAADAPFEIPASHIDVLLLGGGRWDPITDTVELRVTVSTLVHGDEARPLSPFTLHASREDVSRSLAGATGLPLEYPGVLCRAEGQRLPVGSFAPLLVTAPLAR